MSVTSKAVWYIESHLGDDLCLDAIAKAAGVSRFHLSRAFAASTGQPLSLYVRARRLSGAANALVNGSPDILSVALDAGYGSHEAFTRAFRQHFGVTPGELRSHGHAGPITIQEPISMNQATVTSIPQPRVAKNDSLLIFGLSQRCPGVGDAAIPSLWSSFVPHLGHIKGQIGNVAYGVIYNADDSGDYDYLCGVAVDQFPDHPPEFTRVRIPPQKYAVFEHRDHISAIAGTWKAIWEHALTGAGYSASDGPSFELYDERFDGRTGLGGVEIWVPVKD